MEQNVKVMQEKAVLVGLNCDLFTKEEAANERTLDELEALLETAGGVCVGKFCRTGMSRTHTRSSAKEKLKRCASGCRTRARRS